MLKLFLADLTCSPESSYARPVLLRAPSCSSALLRTLKHTFSAPRHMTSPERVLEKRPTTQNKDPWAPLAEAEVNEMDHMDAVLHAKPEFVLW